MIEPFKPKQYHNEFQDKLKKLIEAKQHGEMVEIGGAEPHRAPVIDMMVALKKSLAVNSARPAREKQKDHSQKVLPRPRKPS